MILNEKKYAEILYRSGKLRKQKEFVDLLILGKYFNYISEIENTDERLLDIKIKLLEFSNKYWNYEIKKNKEKVLNKIMELILKYELYMADEIIITRNEIEYIKLLDNKNLQNIMFSILVLCKVQLNNNKRQIKRYETKIKELLSEKKQTKKIQREIEKLNKNIEKRKEYSLIIVDNSKHQTNIFSYCNFDNNITIKKKQELLLELINFGYININTIKNNCKLISINKFENNFNDVIFKINCNPSSDNEYDFFNFQYLLDEIILGKKIDVCQSCLCKINKNRNVQKYCKDCSSKKIKENWRESKRKNK